MELVAELVPPRDPQLLLETAKTLALYYDWIDVPDAPLGKPNYSSPIVSTFLAAHGYRVIAHLRVIDVNIIALKTITKTMGSLGVPRLVYLRGDPPQQGAPVEQVTPEEAVAYALSRPEAPEPGLLVSLRKPQSEIAKRLSSGARFYLALNYDGSPEAREKLAMIAREAPVYVYYIASHGDLKDIEQQRVPGRLESLLQDMPREAAGLIISFPQDMRIVVRLGGLLREAGI